MKKTLLALLSVLILLSCEKDTDQQAARIVSDPTIDKVDFYCVYSGTNQSTKFNVRLTADSSIVASVGLYASPNTKVWEVLKPSTGTYTMYDHLGDCPTYAQNALYYFVFLKRDGTKVTTDPFQVYF